EVAESLSPRVEDAGEGVVYLHLGGHPRLSAPLSLPSPLAGGRGEYKLDLAARGGRGEFASRAGSNDSPSPHRGEGRGEGARLLPLASGRPPQSQIVNVESRILASPQS